MSDAVYRSIHERGYLYEDGHWFDERELEYWPDEMFINTFYEIYPCAK